MKKILVILLVLTVALFFMGCPTPITGFTIETEATNGTITLDPDQETYEEGTEVTVTATPDQGWLFDGWTGSLSGTENPTTLTVDGNEFIGATFVEAGAASVTLVFYFDHPSIPTNGLYTLAGSMTEDLIELGGDGNWTFTAGTDMVTMNSNLLFPVAGTTLGQPITQDLEAGFYDWAILIDTTPGDDDYTNYWTCPSTEATMDQYEFKAGYSYEIRVGVDNDSSVGTTFVTETAPK